METCRLTQAKSFRGSERQLDTRDSGQRCDRESPKRIAIREDDVAGGGGRYREGQQVVIGGPRHDDAAAHD
jgi:hypothetical protein